MVDIKQTEEFLTPDELAAKIKMSKRTIRRLEAKGLPVMKINHQTKIYDFKIVKLWLEENYYKI